ncbi:MAG TPA: hypothetical protein VJB13_02255 [Candidatus Nanoarchaeia archaeon]|nr:hypothetical protein [Candidatus Nanoarchaeia archaeon]
MVILLENKLDLVGFKSWKATPLTNFDDLQKVESGFAKIEGIPLTVLAVGGSNGDYKGIMYLSHRIEDLVCYYEMTARYGMRIAQFLKRAEEDKEKIIIGGKYPDFISPSREDHQIEVHYLEIKKY